MDVLSKIVASNARSKLLTYFNKNEDSEIHFRDLQKALNINPRQLTLELRKLKDISFVKEKKVGNMKFYRANKSAFYFQNLKKFIQSLQSNEDEWFRWERASTIHSLFLTLEAAINRMYKYHNFAWPFTYLIFENENVLWCDKIKDFDDLGAKIINWYRKGDNKKKYQADCKSRTVALNKMFKEIESKNLGKLTDKQILNLYNKFRDIYLDWWVVFWTTEPVSVRVDTIFNEKLPKLNTDELAILTAVTKKSFSQEIEEGYAKIIEALKKKNNNFQNPYIKKLIKDFQKNFYWMFNNYYETKVLSEEDIITEVKKRLKKKKTDNLVIDIKLEKQKLIEKYQIDEDTQEIIEIIEHFTYLQDFRKKWIMITCHYIDKFLEEIGKRGGLSLKDMRYALPNELELILQRKPLPIKERKLKCTIIGNSKTHEISIFQGIEAEIEAKKFEEISKYDSKTSTKVEGNVACPGKAIGEVKVLMNPSEIYKVNHGDILVTSMTSPDFIEAMRKVVAIVTNEGGLTCHAAIISRELNIPCVIGTKNATQILKDGDKVEVDADKGTITVLN